MTAGPSDTQLILAVGGIATTLITVIGSFVVTRIQGLHREIKSPNGVTTGQTVYDAKEAVQRVERQIQSQQATIGTLEDRMTRHEERLIAHRENWAIHQWDGVTERRQHPR